MPKPIIMPKFEMAQETGTVGKWLKRVGDPVRKGEAVLEIETDKITMEVESPADGTLAQIGAQEGAVVPIGTVIAQVALPGESLSAASIQTAPPASEQKGIAQSTGESANRITPVAKRMVAEHGLDPNTLPSHSGRVMKADVEHFLTRQETTGRPAEAGAAIRAVPAARRLARELRVDLAQVQGSGPQGRIQSQDVERAAALQHVPLSTAALTESLPVAPVSPVSPGQPALRRIVPLSAIRRTTAERLVTGWRTSPQFTLSLHVDMSRAQQVIDEVRSATPDVPKLTITAFLVRACAWALQRHPQINASFQEDGIYEWADVNVGVAVAAEAGLLVPVIHHANQLSLLETMASLTACSERARNGKLTSEDLRGGTFTISNLGMFGIEQFTAILNPPQAAILAVGKTVKQVVVIEGKDGSDQTQIRPLANFTLSADHRAVDGAVAGRFLADLKKVVESPALLI